MSLFINDLLGSKKKETWVFIVGGQSNMRSNTGTTGAGNTEVHAVGSLQWGRFEEDNNVLIPTTVPLHNWDNNLTPQYGPNLIVRFSNRLKDLYPNVTQVYIPCAKGGTGFTDGYWNKGDTLYEDMIARTNLCLSENPEFIFKGMLWHQGENDTLDPTGYYPLFNQFNIDWRDDIAAANSNTPFVCGGMLPSWVNANANRIAVNNFLKDIPNNIDYSAFADSELPTALTGHDGIHFTSDSSLILGDRYFDAFLEALNNF